jgi:hypothetical protein
MGLRRNVEYGIFVFSPALHFALSDIDTDYMYRLTLKEKGSNYYIEYSYEFNQDDRPVFSIYPCIRGSVKLPTDKLRSYLFLAAS